MVHQLFGIKLYEERALRRMRAAADRVMASVCWALALAALGFAPWFGEWTAALAVGLPAALLATLLAWRMPGRFTTRMVIAALFMVFAGLLIHESHGLTETHFTVFLLIAFLLYYRDWRPILLAALVIAAHHFAICHLQMRGLPVYVFQAGHACDMVWVHAAYVAIETGVLMYLATLVRREALETIAIARFGQRVIETGLIDLRPATEKRGAVGRRLKSCCWRSTVWCGRGLRRPVACHPYRTM